MQSINNTQPVQSFTITQAFLGAPLQFTPALGSKELEQLVDVYVLGNGSKAEKLSEVTIDFYNNAIVDLTNGALVRTYHVFPLWDALEQSPTESYSSGFSPAFYTPSPASSAMVSDFGSGSISVGGITHSSRKSTGRVSKKASSKKETKKAAEVRLPGFSIMTKDGVDVTSTAGRGTKTKEQREHAHLMRIMKACDACKKKKIRCDPSHRRAAEPSRSSTVSTSTSNSSSSGSKNSPSSGSTSGSGGPSFSTSISTPSSSQQATPPSFETTPSFNTIDDFVLFPEDNVAWNDFDLGPVEETDLSHFNFDINGLADYPPMAAPYFSPWYSSAEAQSAFDVSDQCGQWSPQLQIQPLDSSHMERARGSTVNDFSPSPLDVLNPSSQAGSRLQGVMPNALAVLDSSDDSRQSSQKPQSYRLDSSQSSGSLDRNSDRFLQPTLDQTRQLSEHIESYGSEGSSMNQTQLSRDGSPQSAGYASDGLKPLAGTQEQLDSQSRLNRQLPSRWNATQLQSDQQSLTRIGSRQASAVTSRGSEHTPGFEKNPRSQSIGLLSIHQTQNDRPSTNRILSIPTWLSSSTHVCGNDVSINKALISYNIGEAVGTSNISLRQPPTPVAFSSTTSPALLAPSSQSLTSEPGAYRPAKTDPRTSLVPVTPTLAYRSGSSAGFNLVITALMNVMISLGSLILVALSLSLANNTSLLAAWTKSSMAVASCLSSTFRMMGRKKGLKSHPNRVNLLRLSL